MCWYSKTTCFIIEIVGISINIINSFAANIIVFEETNNVKFNLGLLFKNKLFWIVLILQIMYGIIAFLYNHQNKRSDDRLKKAIESHEIKLMTQAVKYSGKKDFESAEKVFKVLDELEKRRNG